uniref:Uncharacterized protein n=1 Tax=Ovis aries TaxID=9940 RepID=A0AC11D823_SHEEP
MGEEDYYLELCERPVHFEKANPVNCVFFDEANKQVFAVRSGGATGVVVKGPDDRNPISFRFLFIWLSQVFVAACGFFSLWHVGSGSLTSDGTWAPCIENTEFLDTGPPGKSLENNF